MTATPRGHCLALWFLAAVALMGTACSSTDTTADPIGEPVADVAAGDVSWLASQTSHSGRIEFTDGEATQLVMDGIDPHTITFSDRPERLTDVMDTATYVDQWDEMFADSAPNAVLVEHRPDGETDSLVVVLSRPMLDTTSRTLTYDIEVLADEMHPESVRGLTGDVHDEAPTEFRAATLFIDGEPPPDVTPPDLRDVTCAEAGTYCPEYNPS